MHTITQQEYDKLRKHDYAGKTDSDSGREEPVWWLENDPKAGTVLVYGEIAAEREP